MYIEPNTTIRVLKNVPLDPSFDHTIYFESASAQTSYFQSKTKYTLDRQSYQRVQRGYMRINIQAENLYDCNYVMFQNTAFGNKWFYAFIKSVEYINHTVSQIEFEIDVMQTWFFDYTLDRCFVDREHSATDGLFENIVVENLNLGDEYVCNAKDSFDMNNMYVCVLVNRKTAVGTAESKTINNIYTPVNVLAGVPSTDPSSMDALLDEYQEGDIIAVYQYPAILGDDSTTTPAVYNKTIVENLTTIDGYQPRNKKLFSHPYNFILVSNNSGQTATYKWEDWQTGTMIGTRGTFQIKGVFVSTPAVICYPRNYRGIANAYDDGLVLSNFPQCPWSGDIFKAWWAQNKASFVTSGITSVIGTASTGVVPGLTALAVTGNPGIAAAVGSRAMKLGAAAAGVSAAANSANSVAKMQDIKNTPSQTHGQTQTDSLNPGIGRMEFDFYSMSIKAQYARIIDEYFDRYGYATKRNKIPNRNVRPHWTYTKTIGCTISGSIPADDAVAICEIYNNGITFWKNGDEVGNYNLDNTV